MGIIGNVIDFVFPVQQRLYHPTGRFIPNPNQFRSPQLQRRFSSRRLWPNGQSSCAQARSARVPITSPSQFRRPLAQRPLPQPVQKRSFLGEMFSNNINPPAMRAQPKRNGFGKLALDAVRWNNILRR